MTSQQLPAHFPPQPAPNFSLLNQYFDSTPANYKRQGEDWFAIFNHNVPRLLDVSILHTFEHPSVVCCVRFSADGKYIATGCNKSAQIFDVKTGAKVVTLVDENASNERATCISAVYASVPTVDISRRGQKTKSFESGMSTKRKSSINSSDMNKIFIPSISLATELVLPLAPATEQPDYGIWKRVKIY